MRKRAARIASLVIALILVLGSAQKYFFARPDPQAIRSSGFYMEDKNSLDVIFMGASEVYAGFSSAQAYGEYGFTSYPYAFTANPVSLWKNELIEAGKRPKPSLIVMEINGALYNSGELFGDDKVRRFTDDLPLSANKIDTVSKLGTDEKISYYLPFFKYHSRWKEPVKSFSGMQDRFCLKARGHSLLRGEFTKTGSACRGIRKRPGQIKGSLFLDTQARTYLVNFLDYCRENKIPILFVRFPHRMGDPRGITMYKRSRTAAKIIRSYGFPYLDLEGRQERIGLDGNDYYNNDHLNRYGQKKLTSYLGAYIKKHYDIGHVVLSSRQKRQWQESADYMEYFDRYYREADARFRQAQLNARLKGEPYRANADVYETRKLVRRLESMGK